MTSSDFSAASGASPLSSLTDDITPTDNDIETMKRVLATAGARPDLIPTTLLSYLADYFASGNLILSTNQIANITGRVSPLLLKGDIWGYDGTENVRVPVGTNGFVLTADSGATDGVSWAAGAGSLIASFVQTTGTDATTTSATQADVDATNATVTFTAPASGKVLVRATALVEMAAGAATGQLGLREGSTNIAGPHDVLLDNASTGQKALVSPVWKITGLSAGSHTYKLAFSVSAAVTFTVHQLGSAATNYPVTLEVWYV